MRRRLLMTSIGGGGSFEHTFDLLNTVLYDKSSGELFSTPNPTSFNKDEYEPVGIVVIPGSHNVYGTGESGVMALLSASTSSPDAGSTSNQTMYWGQYGTDISELYNYLGTTSYGTNDTWTAVQYHAGRAYLPSDRSSFGEKLMNKLSGSDQNCWYYYNDSDHHTPSPYLNDGSRNPDYYNTALNAANALSDFKGKENTDILISKATSQSDWKTALSITNNSGAGYSPAACACWRYSITGTKQGDWYLPAMGELGYTCVRIQKINDTISALQSHFGKTFCLLGTDYFYWSSSEYSSDYAWGLDFDRGYVYYDYSKGFSSLCVRPFLRKQLEVRLNPKPKEYEYVDMGLSVNWATCNIGANSPEEYGWYFQWGGTTAYNSDRTPVEGGEPINFGWNSNCPYWARGSGSSSKWSKYAATDGYSSTGTADNKLVLEPEDDAAHVHLGGEWRMPTEAEFIELIKTCDTEWVTDYNGTGIAGRLFTLKSDLTKTLFFPASSNLYGTSWYDDGSYGYCWSSSLYSFRGFCGYGLYFDSDGDYDVYDHYRYNGLPVRGVRPKK